MASVRYTRTDIAELKRCGVTFIHSKKLSSSALFSYLTRTGYNAGKYGHNFDVFFINTYIAIITGDRPSYFQRNATEAENNLIVSYSEKIENAENWTAKKELLEQFKNDFVALN